MMHEENGPGVGPSIAEPDFEIPVREATSPDLTEVRILVERIFEKYVDSGGRTELDRLLENREHLPRYLPEVEIPR